MNKLRLSIEKLGYKYSIVQYLKNLLIYSFIIIGLSLVHKLKWIYALFLFITIIVVLPYIIYAQFRYTYEFQRFNDYCLYLKQMIIQYKTHKKIKTALEMTREAFTSNKSIMLSLITKAIEAIETGVPYEKALRIIEEKYPHHYLKKLHAYLILGEMIGGNQVYSSLEHVDYETWQSDMIQFQKQKNQVRQTNIYFTLLSIGISLFCLYFFPKDLMEPLFGIDAYQIVTFIYFEILLLAYTLVTCGLTGDWLKERKK